MSTQSDYTPQEWETLAYACAAAGAATASSTRSLRRKAPGKKEEAFLTAIKPEAAAPELLQTLSQAAAQQWAVVKQRYDLKKQGDELAVEAVEQCKSAAALLAQKAASAEITMYRQWVMKAAEAVALAVKDAELMNIGGEIVSAKEHKILKELATALGISRYEPPHPE